MGGGLVKPNLPLQNFEGVDVVAKSCENPCGLHVNHGMHYMHERQKKY